MIPEEQISKYLDMLLTKSDPGDSIHTLLTVAAPKDAGGPFGFATEDQQKINMYALAYVDGQTADTLEQFIGKAMLAAIAEHGRQDEVILFAALSLEMQGVEKVDELAVRLAKEGRIAEHPDLCEATLVYATCRDGRRWQGTRFLTGAKAGDTFGPDVLTGPVDHQKEYHGKHGFLLRRMVGIE